MSVSLARFVPLFVCAACPSEGGDWSCLLWLDDARPSWWVGAGSSILRGEAKG